MSKVSGRKACGPGCGLDRASPLWPEPLACASGVGVCTADGPLRTLVQKEDPGGIGWPWDGGVKSEERGHPKKSGHPD